MHKISIVPTILISPRRVDCSAHFCTDELGMSAPPGKLRLLLESAEAVRKVYAALHCQALLVGQDRVGIEVGNDLVDRQSVPGNAQRGRV